MRRRCLGDVAVRVRDRVSAGTVDAPFVGLEHLVPGQLRVGGRGAAGDQRSDGLAFRRGDVLFGRLRPGFRKVAIAPCDGVGSAELLVLRPRPGEHAGFVLAWLAHPDTIATAVRLATGTRMPRVRWSDLASLSRPVPDREGRRAIGRLVSLFDERLDLVHRQDATATALLREAVRRVAGPRGPSLGDVATPRAHRGTAAPGAPVLSVSDLSSADLAVHTWGDDPGHSAKRPVEPGDVLVSRLRPELRKAGICPVSGLASPEIVPFVTGDLWRGVIAGRVVDPAVQARWIALGTGTRMPRVPVQALADTPLGVDEATARRLAPGLEPVVEGLVRRAQLAGRLRELRDRVLRDLLDGRLDPGARPRPTG